MIDTVSLLLLAALAGPIDSSSAVPTPTDSVLAALVSAQVKPGDALRVWGGFGTLAGYSSTIGPRGLELVSARDDMRHPAPARLLGWSQIDRIDRDVTSRKDGARIGAVLGGFFGLALTMATISGRNSSSDAPGSLVLAAGVIGGAGGAVLGWAMGDAVGSKFPQWRPVYERR